MTAVRKYLYLLQLEEYETKRYFRWLEQNKIDDLEERKSKLKKTPRLLLILIISRPLSLFLGDGRAIGLANNLLSPFCTLGVSILVFLAKIKLLFCPRLVKIVVTGSYGKTTFKEMLYGVLSSKYLVLKTEGNVNTLPGIAFTLLKKLNPRHQVLIVEAGAYDEGEIRKICRLINPSIGVITIVGLMHLERFGDIENIRRAKFEIAEFIKDKKKFFAPQKNHQFIDFVETIVRIGQILEIDKNQILSKLKKFKAPQHRLSVKVINPNLIILDDTYNSNPLGFKRALSKLKKFKNHQKIVVTPGMIELGQMQKKLNQEAAKDIAQIADVLVIVGRTNKEALLTAKSLKPRLKVLTLDKDEAVEDKIMPFLKLPAVILWENDLPDHYF